MFWTKKSITPLTSDEYEKVLKKLTEFAASLSMASSKVDRLETDFRSLRSKVNNHIIAGDEEENEPTSALGQQNIKTFSPFINK